MYECNPQVFRDKKTQYPPKINVGAEILGNNIIDNFFMTENSTGNHYLTILQDAINPMITHIVENSVNFPENHFISEESN